MPVIVKCHTCGAEKRYNTPREAHKDVPVYIYNPKKLEFRTHCNLDGSVEYVVCTRCMKKAEDAAHNVIDEIERRMILEKLDIPIKD